MRADGNDGICLPEHSANQVRRFHSLDGLFGEFLLGATRILEKLADSRLAVLIFGRVGLQALFDDLLANGRILNGLSKGAERDGSDSTHKMIVHDRLPLQNLRTNAGPHRITHHMDRLLQDLLVTFRRLRRGPGFAAAAILTLALGIGANTTIFSLVNAIVFRPFGVERQKELVFFNMHTAKNEFPSISYPDYKDYRQRNTVFTDMALYRIAPLNMSRGGGENSRLWSYEVSGNYFDMLGVKPIRGRVLHTEDDVKRAGHPVAVITYNCWQRRFGGDPDIAGRKVKVNGLDFTILGVTPAGFIGTELIFTPEVFVPIAMVKQIEGFDWLDDRHNGNGMAIGRLKPGVSMKGAQAAINSIAEQLGREYPSNAGISIVLSPPGMAGTYLRGAITGFSAVLMVVAGMVLLIACVNLASLLLARAADRRKDTAIRLALGASRSNLIRQLLTESTVLSIAGGAAGVLLASWLTGLVNAWSPPIDVPVIPHVGLDLRVMLFAAAVSVFTGLLFGLAPALQSTRTSLSGAIKNDAPSDKFRRVNLRDVLVASQVALSLVLLIGSVLVVRSLQHVLSLHLGFEPRHAAVLSFDLGLQGYDETRAGFHAQIVRQSPVHARN